MRWAVLLCPHKGIPLGKHEHQTRLADEMTNHTFHCTYFAITSFYTNTRQLLAETLQGASHEGCGTQQTGRLNNRDMYEC